MKEEIDLLKGKIKRPYGVKEYQEPEEEMDKPMVPPASSGRARYCVRYQVFGEKNGIYCGRVSANIGPESIRNLTDYRKEWWVAHLWTHIGENCIVITRRESAVTFGIYLRRLGGYQEWVHYSADHNFNIGIRGEHQEGSREINSVYFWVWDKTDDVFWDKTYDLPETERVRSVDAALECYSDITPLEKWKTFTDYTPLDINLNHPDLSRIYHDYKEWKCDDVGIYNDRKVAFFDDYGPNTVATVSQKKLLIPTKMVNITTVPEGAEIYIDGVKI